jgi:hypothetical protein
VARVGRRRENLLDDTSVAGTADLELWRNTVVQSEC